MYRIVIDTNVFISALMSRQGASHLLIDLTGEKKFEFALSVPLALEYEAVAKRLMETKIHLSAEQIDKAIGALCQLAKIYEIYYLWRPFLSDPKDDMVLELAVRSESAFVVTHNISDFRSIDQFGLKALSPKSFLQQIEVLK